MTIDAEQLRTIMRSIPAPVGVVVAEVQAGTWRGMTASSLTSVSLAPPLVSFNVTRGSQMHRVLLAADSFTFNLLAADQQTLAERFATRSMSPRDQFDGIGHVRHPGGAVVLEGAVSWLHCTPHTRFEAGDHSIIVGEVQQAHVVRATEPLVVFGGTFHSVGPGTELDADSDDEDEDDERPRP